MVVALLNLPPLQNWDLADRLQEHVLECERLGVFFFNVTFSKPESLREEGM